MGEGDRLDLEHGAIQSFTDPLDSVFLGDQVATADFSLGMFALLHTTARTGEHDVEVHAVDAGGRVELHAEIDVLLDAEAEVACVSAARHTIF